MSAHGRSEALISERVARRVVQRAAARNQEALAVILPLLGMPPLFAGARRLRREIAALVPHLPIVILVSAIRANRRSSRVRIDSAGT